MSFCFAPLYPVINSAWTSAQSGFPILSLTMIAVVHALSQMPNFISIISVLPNEVEPLVRLGKCQSQAAIVLCISRPNEHLPNYQVEDMIQQGS